MKKAPVDVFSDWVHQGKDDGMERNHLPAVEAMLGHATQDLPQFSFIDAGCGNGWVVRKVAQQEACTSALGIDGSPEMIQKAQALDGDNPYICDDLMEWAPDQPVTLVHSMEVFYYFKEPEKLVRHVHDHWLAPGGRLIIGLDFYTENEESHSWYEYCCISIMELFPENSWKAFFRNAGFQQVETWRIGEKEGWAGTLIITGAKAHTGT